MNMKRIKTQPVRTIEITVPGPRFSIAFESLKTATRAEVQRMATKEPVLKKLICQRISIHVSFDFLFTLST